jgi:arylsulfatase A-like enzyme
VKTKVAAAWLLLGVFELALTLLIPAPTLLSGPLTPGARVTLAAFGLVMLLVGMSAMGLILRPLRRVRFAGAIVIWIAAVLYVASWGTFWNTGTFLDREAFAFLAPQPIQTFHWVYPPLALGLLALTFVLTWVIGVAVPRWVERRGPETGRRIVQIATVTAALCVAVAAGGHFLYDTQSGNAGPLVHVLRDVERRWLALSFVEGPSASSPSASAGGTTMRVVRRPVIGMDEYLVSVDSNRVRRLNVVMVQVESLRSDQLRAYGGTRDVMPTLDALAREGRVFTRAYVQASHSNYADLVPLSSHYPLRTREMYTFPPNPPYPRVLIYDVLTSLGYRAAIFSSQNENWGGMINYHRPSSLDRFFHAETFGGPTYTPWEDIGFADWVKQTGNAGSVDDRYTVDEAIEWIDHVAGQPFFLHMNLQSSHVPYVVPPDFPTRFGPRELDFPIMWGRFPEDRVADVKNRYADSLAFVDSQIARLFDHLRRRGLWETTVFVIGGDNGEAFYEHGFAAHASWLFDEVVKVPMIIRAPGLAPGLDDRPSMFLDIPPSLLELLNLPPHPSFQGISLFEPRPNRARSIYMIVQTPLAYETAIVRDGFKLHFAEREDKYFLNDLVNDPREMIDLAPERPQLVQQLAARLHRWRDEQLAYYADIERQKREYPPVLED